MKTSRCYEILEISPDASYEEAKSAYRMLCQIWHPDKYTHSAQLHTKATNKIKEINAAWSQIEDDFKARKDGNRSKRFEQENKQSNGVQEEPNKPRKDALQVLPARHVPVIQKRSSIIAKSLAGIAFLGFSIVLYTGKKQEEPPVAVPVQTVTNKKHPPVILQFPLSDIIPPAQVQSPTEETHPVIPEQLPKTKVDPPATKQSPRHAVPAAPAPAPQSRSKAGITPHLSPDERIALDKACASSQLQGLAAYKQCIHQETSGSRKLPDISYLSHNEKIALDTACASSQAQGLAAYRQCVWEEVSGSRRLPDISYLSQNEKIALDKACASSQAQGLAAYRQCVWEEVSVSSR